MTALEQEQRFLRQKLAMLEANFDTCIDDLEEHEAMIERLEGRMDSLGDQIKATRLALGMECKA